MVLAQIAGDAGDAPALSLPDLVQQSLGDDDLAAPLAAALRQREANAAAADDDKDGDDEPGALADPEVADVIERVYAELEALRERTRVLAEALGACPLCWGEDELCPVCRGRGRPGGRAPDAHLYAELVEPASRRRHGPRPDDPTVVVQTLEQAGQP
jgi:hypothetical protein